MVMGRNFHAFGTLTFRLRTSLQENVKHYAFFC